MARRTRSGTGVGPAVRRYSFMVASSLGVFAAVGRCLFGCGGGPSSNTTSPADPPMSLAQFADASFAYPGNDILVGASLLIRPGDRLALLGPNGTGKSTALRLLSGDLQADSGDVRVLGRASVAYLRQSQELSGGGTLLEALLEPF